MFDRLKKLYDNKRLTKAELKNAVKRGWITWEEYETITSEAYD